MAEFELEKEYPDVDDDDEPQFKVDKSAVKEKPAKKEGKAKGGINKKSLIIMVAALVAVALASFKEQILPKKAEIVASAELSQPEELTLDGSAYTANSTARQFVTLDDSVSESIETSGDAIESTGSQANVISAGTVVGVPSESSGYDGSDINAALLKLLEGLRGDIEAVNTEVKELKGQILTSERTAGKQRLNLIDALSEVERAVRAVQVDGKDRDVALNQISSVVSGFKVDVAEQRKSFSLKILHAEFWGGKIRLVGYDNRQPENILKIFEGQVVGFWTFVSWDDDQGVAVFRHKDGHTHEVNLS